MEAVSGHGNVKISKEYIVKKMDDVETRFFIKFQELQKNKPELLRIMPRVLFIDGNNIKMTRVGQELVEPKMCDVKIGFRTFSRQEYFLNRHITSKIKGLKMAFLDMIKGSIANGYRIEGISGKQKQYIYKNPRRAIEEFLGPDPKIYQSALDQLNDVKNIMKQQDFTFIGSSTLFAVDKDRKSVEVKLIDFAHPFYKSMNEREFNKIQKSFLRGLDNLINVIKESKFKEEPKKKSMPDLVDWKYRPDDFCKKLKSDGTPDIEKQNEVNARIWYHTIYSKLNPQSPGFNIEAEKALVAQKEVLLRNICAISVCEPMEGSQEKWSYSFDDTHSIAQLLSGGGRFGYIFEDEDTGRKFINHLIIGDENKSFQNEIGKGNIYKRISTHNQKLENGHFIEVKHFATPVDNAYGMNFPIGGIGNTIESDGKKTTVGYYGEAQGGKYQLGTMVLKFDSEGGKGRLMCGFEATAPNRKNQLGGEHGIISTVDKNLRRFLQKTVKDLKLPINGDRLLPKRRSLTGQSKGYEIGIFGSYGSNVAMVSYEKMQKYQKLYKVLSEMDEERQKDFVKSMLLSSSRRERENIYKTAMEHEIKKDDNIEIRSVERKTSFSRDIDTTLSNKQGSSFVGSFNSLQTLETVTLRKKEPLRASSKRLQFQRPAGIPHLEELGVLTARESEKSRISDRDQSLLDKIREGTQPTFLNGGYLQKNHNNLLN